MKLFLLLVVLVNSPMAFAQGLNTNVPPDLSAARARYQDAISSAKSQYLQELDKLKSEAGLANNSELVTAVNKEIEAMGGTVTAPAPDLGGAQAPTIESVSARLDNTTWVWYGWETITLLHNGTAKFNGAASTFTWSVISVSPPTIQGKSSDGRGYKMVLDANLKAGQILQDKEVARPTSRMKRQ